MMQLVDYLYRQIFKDTQTAFQLTLLDLPNLLALLDWLPGHVAPEQIVATAGSIEELLSVLGRPAALDRAVAARKAAAGQIGGWSHAQFQHERLGIERLLAASDLSRAYQAAAALQQRSLAAGEAAYSGAAYDIAVAHFLLGRALRIGGQAGAALQPLAEAQRCFQALADAGLMGAKATDEQGACSVALGKLNETAEYYIEAAKRLDELDDRRGAAVSKGQLGTVRMHQERYADALAAHEEARAIFERLGEPGSVAAAWYQIGIVHREARQFEAAERAYRQGLGIRVQHKLRSDEAASLNELGNLYNAWDRPEQAVTFCRQAADIYTTLGDQASEGRARNNIAVTLHKLGRNNEARREILRAIVCKQPFGHAALPWTSYAILQEIEQAAGNGVAAWRQARDAYLDYRQNGGYAQAGTGKLGDAIWQAVQENGVKAATEFLQQVIQLQGGANLPTAWTRFQTILEGNRDSALADDPDLYYSDSAELLLLLERLGG